MTCEQSQSRLIDVVYGEDLDPRDCFHFFQHLEGCEGCRSEYLELLETRTLLSDWKIEGAEEGVSLPPGLGKSSAARLLGWRGRTNWWMLLQKAAAAFLILVGAVSILQGMGYLGGRKLMVSQPQLTEMVHDMIVAQQAEERRVIGMALVQFAEEMERKHRADMQNVYSDMLTVEERFVRTLEDQSRTLKAYLSK